MKKQTLLLIIVMLALTLFTGCGSSTKETSPAPAAGKQAKALKDGTYTAKSGPDDRGAVGEVTLVIEKGKIVKADYKGVMKDGKIKDVDYGKTNGTIENQAFYNKAQHAVKSLATYGPKLVETQDLGKVDAVSGATLSYNQFAEAVKKALDQAGR